MAHLFLAICHHTTGILPKTQALFNAVHDASGFG
jgi:hypothetical protein